MSLLPLALGAGCWADQPIQGPEPSLALAGTRPFVPDGSGFVAPLPSVGTSVRFDERGARLGDGDQPVHLRFAGWGPASGVDLAPDVAPALGGCGDDRRRLTYTHAGVCVWWAAITEGVELGWTVHAPPGRPEALAFAVDVTGAAAVRVEGRGAEILALDGRRWGVSGVSAWDADGVPLPAELRVDGARVWVEVAAAAAYPITVDPLITTAAWSDAGERPWFELGRSVAGGDFDGDGYSDLVVGVPDFYYSGFFPQYGQFRVHPGGPAGVSARGSFWTGEEGNAGFAGALASAGDVNGDGYDDLLVGASSHEVEGRNGVGEAFAYYGSSTGLSAAADWTEEGEIEVDQGYFGALVAGAGDVNGDGYADVVVSAYRAEDSSGRPSGKVYVYHGSADGLPEAADWSATGETYSNFGLGVAGAGDVNGDGYDDLIVGAPGSGHAYLYLGSATGLDPSPAWTVTGDSSMDFARSVAGVGDVDGDGYDDVVVGAEGWQDESIVGRDLGRADLYYGGAGGLAATPGWSATAYRPGDHFGAAVAGAGDVNGDGYADVVIGAPDNDRRYSEGGGQVWAYYGGPSGLGVHPWVARGLFRNGQFGAAVAGVGDIDGDGYDDVAVGAPGEIDRDRGRVFAYRGSPDVDADGDGYYTDVGTPADCDDTDPTRTGYPTEYEDRDGDGHGDPAAAREARGCHKDPGYALVGDDADDSDARVH